MNLRGVEIFSVGRWNDVKTFDQADLDAMVASFEDLQMGGRAPLKLGHNDDQAITDGQPALGWVERIYREGDRLLADFTDLPRVLYDAIKAGRYKFTSVELLRDAIFQGKEFPWVLSAVALLGADLPAVSNLKDLQALTHSRRAEFSSGTRVTFNLTNGERNPMTTDTQRLQAENRRLQQELVKRELDDAVRAGRILARDRHAFERRMGADATLEDARQWIQATPRPAQLNHGRPGAGVVPGDDGMPAAAPDAEVVRLALAEVERSGGKLTYSQASIKVLRANPELADRYRYQPGVKDS